jgi:RNA polymerase sigma-70 factor (ECF subfamily)
MGRVERPIRVSLRPFARAIDVEAVVQEALMRMWLLATDREHARELTGENASLRFAIGMARNLARNAARRVRRERLLPPDDLPEASVEPDPTPDPGLRQAIDECLERLARRPREALLARLGAYQVLADRALAESLGMSLNAFLQNIVRARRQMADCLAGKGVPLGELRS